MLWAITIKLDILSLSAAGWLVITQLQLCVFLCTRDFVDFAKSFFTFQCFVVTVLCLTSWLGVAVTPENAHFFFHKPSWKRQSICCTQQGNCKTTQQPPISHPVGQTVVSWRHLPCRQPLSLWPEYWMFFLCTLELHCQIQWELCFFFHLKKGLKMMFHVTLQYIHVRHKYPFHWVNIYHHLLPCSILTKHQDECGQSPGKPQRISIYTVQVLRVFMSNQGLIQQARERALSSWRWWMDGKDAFPFLLNWKGAIHIKGR